MERTPLGFKIAKVELSLSGFGLKILTKGTDLPKENGTKSRQQRFTTNFVPAKAKLSTDSMAIAKLSQDPESISGKGVFERLHRTLFGMYGRRLRCGLCFCRQETSVSSSREGFAKQFDEASDVSCLVSRPGQKSFKQLKTTPTPPQQKRFILHKRGASHANFFGSVRQTIPAVSRHVPLPKRHLSAGKCFFFVFSVGKCIVLQEIYGSVGCSGGLRMLSGSFRMKKRKLKNFFA